MAAADKYRDVIIQAVLNGEPVPASLSAGDALPSERVDRWIGDQLGRFVGEREGARLGRKIGGVATTLIPVDAPTNLLAASNKRMEAVGRGDRLGALKAEGEGALNLLAMAGIGAAASRGGKLAMDKASRMARAKNMGFDVDQRLFHGTAAPDIEAFKPSKIGRTQGVWTTDSPALADQFAARETAKSSRPHSPGSLPLLHRGGRVKSIHASQLRSHGDLQAALSRAFEDEGFDTVRIIRHFSAGGEPAASYIVKNPAQLRSIHAKFDPKKRDSSDLLAGLAVGASGGLAASLLSGQAKLHPLLPAQEKSR